jgi:hypothetical protein
MAKRTELTRFTAALATMNRKFFRARRGNWPADHDDPERRGGAPLRRLRL